jgi:hypothetical protein
LGLLEALSPVTGVLAGENEPDEHLYRGHGSSALQLVPSAFRGRKLPGFSRGRRGRRTWESQIQAEIDLLWTFFNIADERGLKLPEDSQRLRGSLESCRDLDFMEKVAEGDLAWPPDELLSVLALAQHHGVPTSGGCRAAEARPALGRVGVPLGIRVQQVWA